MYVCSNCAMCSLQYFLPFFHLLAPCSITFPLIDFKTMHLQREGEGKYGSPYIQLSAFFHRIWLLSNYPFTCCHLKEYKLVVSAHPWHAENSRFASWHRILAHKPGKDLCLWKATARQIR